MFAWFKSLIKQQKPEPEKPKRVNRIVYECEQCETVLTVDSLKVDEWPASSPYNRYQKGGHRVYYKCHVCQRERNILREGYGRSDGHFLGANDYEKKVGDLLVEAFNLSKSGFTPEMLPETFAEIQESILNIHYKQIYWNNNTD